MKRLSFLFFSCIAITLSSIAQRNFVNGYVVLSNNDTVKGFIDYRNWEKNPSRIIFKNSDAEREQVFTTNEIIGFAVDGFDRYRRAVVQMDMNPIDLRDLSENAADITVTDTVFLRILVDGNRFNLYEFVNFKPHYFIKSASGEIEELTYTVKLSSSTGTLEINNGFQVQLRKILSSISASNDKFSKTYQLKYEARSLAPFVASLNDPQSVFISHDAKKSKNEIKFFAGGGVAIGKLGFSGPDASLNSLVFKTSVSFAATFGVDFTASRNFQRLIFRLQVSANGFNAEGQGISGSNKNEYDLRQINITPGMAVIYIFNGTGTARVYGGGELGYNLSFYPSHVLTSTNQTSGSVSKREDFPRLKDSWVAINLKAGVIINNKMELGLTQHVGGSFINYINISENSHPTFFQIFYRIR